MATPKKTEAGTYRIQVEAGGSRDAGTFPTAKAAKEWAIRRKAEMLAGSEKTGRHTLRQAIKKYSEEVSTVKRGRRTEEIRLKAFQGPGHSTLPLDKQLTKIVPMDLAIWRDARLSMNARGSVLRDMTLLSSVFEIARREWRWCKENPMRDVRRPAEPDHRKRIITRSEIKRMLRQLGHTPNKTPRTVSGAVALAFCLALRTGMREGEICSIKWQDVQPTWITLHTSKTGTGRDVPLSAQARRTIRQAEGIDRESVFALHSNTLSTLFRRARQRAGMSGFTFHDARHTAATQIGSAGRIGVLDMCKMFGWKDPKMAMTYYNPTAEEIARRLSPLPR